MRQGEQQEGSHFSEHCLGTGFEQLGEGVTPLGLTRGGGGGSATHIQRLT